MGRTRSGSTWRIASGGALIAIAWLSGCAAPVATTGSGSSTAIEHEMERYINALRQKGGLPPLTSSPALVALSQGHSADMATGRVRFGHGGVEARARAAKAAHSTPVAENVARSKARKEEAASDAMNRWLDSRIHRENIHGPFRWMGVGAARDARGEYFFTLMLAGG